MNADKPYFAIGFPNMLSAIFSSIYAATLVFLSSFEAFTAAELSFLTLLYAALYALVALRSIKYSSANFFCFSVMPLYHILSGIKKELKKL